MPPALDIYALTKHRDRSTIERFLNDYVDRARCEDRGTEEIMMVALNTPENSSLAGGGDAWESEPSLTLSHNIDRGLDYPRRAFTVYLRPTNKTLDRVYLAFTTDDQIVVGLSVDDTGQMPEKEKYARELLDQLINEFDASLGLIIVETPPPLNASEFIEQKNAPLLTHFWESSRADEAGEKNL